MIEVAEILLAQPGRPMFRQAALRRAVSTAYYAVFHTICQTCGDGVRLWTVGGDDLEQVYRSVDHSRVKEVLASKAVQTLHPDLPRIGNGFAELQRFRHEADYSQPGRLVGRPQLISDTDAKALVGSATSVIGLVDQLPGEIRRRLAILILFRPKPTARGIPPR